MTTPQVAAPPVAPERATRGHWWILVVIAGAQLMVVLDSTIMIIALPSAQHALGFSNTDRQWVVTAYTLAFGGFLLLGGRIGDMFGPKRTLLVGVIGFATASAIGGAAQTTLMLIAARGLQGLFGALLAPSVLALLTSTFADPHERGRAFGIYATIAIAGSAFGLILGGFLTQYVDWRWCLYVNLPIAGLVILGTVTNIPDGVRAAGVRLDVLGVILGCGGLVALVYGLGQAGADGWSAPSVVYPLIGAGILLAAFIFWQSKGPNPLLPLRVLKNRNRAGVVPDHHAGHRRDVRHLPLPHLPAPDDRPLLTAQDRRRLPPLAGAERSGRHPGGEPPDDQGSGPVPDRARTAAGGGRRRPPHDAHPDSRLRDPRAALGDPARHSAWASPSCPASARPPSMPSRPTSA